MTREWIWVLPILILASCENGTHEDELKTQATPLFDLLPSQQSGIDFSNNLTENLIANILEYEYFYNGGGVAIGDIDGDGLPDIYITGNQVKNKLYHNKGNLTFEDITTTAGVEGKIGWTTGVTMADVNADGYLDIYVCKSGKYQPSGRKNELYINNGDLTFTESAAEFCLNDPGYSTQALFFDYDRDNDLDMFLLNHSIQLFTGRDALKLKKQIDPYAGDKLFRNENGTFIDVSEHAGIHQNPLGYGLGVAASDVNQDGWPDIYVTNDYVEPDYMYINNGDGTFSENIKEATFHISNFGMGVDIADINNDARPDIYVADMVAEDNYRQKTNMGSMAPEKFYQAVKFGFHHQYMFNTLQLNRGNLHFSEIAQMAGISNTDWSWATLLVDLNNDGLKDLLVTNGFRKEFSNKDFVNFRNEFIDSVRGYDKRTKLKAFNHLLEQIPETKLANYVFENQGDLSFSKRAENWGFSIPSHSNGASVADLDNDGDLDIVISNIDDTAFVYRNNTNLILKANYLRVKLKGPAGNTSGIGTKLYLKVGGQNLFREHFLSRGYQSSVEDIVHFGLGDHTKINRIQVIWPDRKIQELKNITANKTLVIDYQEAGDHPPDYQVTEEPLFTEITAASGIDYIHRENKFDDFAKEILLPHKMSRFGPGIAVGDVNGDGFDDFFIGGAAGSSGKLYLQMANGNFSPANSQPWQADRDAEDLGCELFDADNDGDLDLYVVSGGNEFSLNDPLLQDRLYLNDGRGGFTRSATALPKLLTSGSVVRPFDFDEDGDQDLFVGGRLVPGRYPTPAPSHLLLNENGKFKDVTEALCPGFSSLGLVTDARWTDLEQDQSPELVVSGEWMSLRVFEYQGDRFAEITEEMGLQDHCGWWYSVEATDLDNDGDTDLVGGNLGLNYKYKASTEEPFQVYYSDFDGNGTGDIVLGYFNQGELFPLRGRQCSSQQMPFLKKKFPSYHDFGKANLFEVYGAEALEKAIHYTASTFASTVFINGDDGTFEMKSLPPLAQISSVNAIVPDDFDGDGTLDLLIAGNLYPVEVETPRNDASIGLFLKGMGEGQWQAQDALTSGFMADGDVKIMKKIRLANGHMGILVGRNSGRLSLFQTKSKPQEIAMAD